MCGGTYDKWNGVPRQLIEIQGQPLLVRTIRLLRENGVTDIAISSNDSRFENFGVPLLRCQKNNYHISKKYQLISGYWHDGFLLLQEPVCYIFGDVFFSSVAIKTIVETETSDIEFFASSPPFRKDYIKEWAEPFALKVADSEKLTAAIKKVEEYDRQKLFKRKPIMWELWQVIKGTPLNKIDYKNYTIINDYTCDIDGIEDVAKIERILKGRNEKI